MLSYSGTFVDQARGSNPEYPFGAWEYHATLIPGSETKAAPHLVPRQRVRQRRDARGVDARQLGARQPADVAGAEGEGLSA